MENAQTLTVKGLVEALNQYRQSHFDEIKQVKNLGEDDINQWAKGKKQLKDIDILSLAEVLGVSCDQLLKGTKPEYQLATEELGLSEKVFDSLKADKSGNLIDRWIDEKTGNTWSSMINFFFEDDSRKSLLLSIYEFIRKDYAYEKFIADETNSGDIAQLLTPDERRDVDEMRLSKQLEKANADYNKKSWQKYLDDRKEV